MAVDDRELDASHAASSGRLLEPLLRFASAAVGAPRQLDSEPSNTLRQSEMEPHAALLQRSLFERNPDLAVLANDFHGARALECMAVWLSGYVDEGDVALPEGLEPARLLHPGEDGLAQDDSESLTKGAQEAVSTMVSGLLRTGKYRVVDRLSALFLAGDSVLSLLSAFLARASTVLDASHDGVRPDEHQLVALLGRLEASCDCVRRAQTVDELTSWLPSLAQSEVQFLVSRYVVGVRRNTEKTTRLLRMLALSGFDAGVWQRLHLKQEILHEASDLDVDLFSSIGDVFRKLLGAGRFLAARRLLAAFPWPSGVPTTEVPVLPVQGFSLVVSSTGLLAVPTRRYAADDDFSVGDANWELTMAEVSSWLRAAQAVPDRWVHGAARVAFWDHVFTALQGRGFSADRSLDFFLGQALGALGSSGSAAEVQKLLRLSLYWWEMSLDEGQRTGIRRSAAHYPYYAWSRGAELGVAPPELPWPAETGTAGSERERNVGWRLCAAAAFVDAAACVGIEVSELRGLRDLLRPASARRAGAMDAMLLDVITWTLLDMGRFVDAQLVCETFGYDSLALSNVRAAIERLEALPSELLFSERIRITVHVASVLGVHYEDLCGDSPAISVANAVRTLLATGGELELVRDFAELCNLCADEVAQCVVDHVLEVGASADENMAMDATYVVEGVVAREGRVRRMRVGSLIGRKALDSFDPLEHGRGVALELLLFAYFCFRASLDLRGLRESLAAISALVTHRGYTDAAPLLGTAKELALCRRALVATLEFASLDSVLRRVIELDGLSQALYSHEVSESAEAQEALRLAIPRALRGSSLEVKVATLRLLGMRLELHEALWEQAIRERIRGEVHLHRHDETAHLALLAAVDTCADVLSSLARGRGDGDGGGSGGGGGDCIEESTDREFWAARHELLTEQAVRAAKRRSGGA